MVQNNNRFWKRETKLKFVTKKEEEEEDEEEEEEEERNK